MSRKIGAGCAARRLVRRAALFCRACRAASPAATFTWLFVGLVSNAVASERPPAYVPAVDELIERLPAGYGNAGSVPSLERANRWLALAARHGDGRLAGRAESDLARLPATPEVRRARAWAAQHRHDFATANALLDALVEADPRDVASRAMRAQIDVVQGRVRDARRRCAELALLGVDSALRCSADVARRVGERAAARRALDRLLTAAVATDVRRDLLVARAALGGADADADFRAATALAPDDVRTMSALARHWRESGRPADILASVPADTTHTGLLLERVIAAKSLGDARWQADAAALERAWARLRQAGATPELRDEAAFHLLVRDDPSRALVLAQANWAEQRDSEDEAILLAAARAAGDAAAVAEVARWRSGEGLPP